MIEKIWGILTPIISAIIGIWAANKFNIFELMPFVPKDFMYEVCITAYFTIVDVILDGVKNNLLEWMKKTFLSAIEVVFYPPNTELSIDANPLLVFNSQDLAEVCIAIRIKGKKKHFQGSTLQIKNPAFADIQSNYRRSEIQVLDNIYTVNLENLFGGSESTDFKQEFRMIFAQIPVDGESTATVIPEITNKHFNVIYKHNNVQIRAVRR